MKRNSVIYHKTSNEAYRESQKTYAEKMKPDERLCFRAFGCNIFVEKNNIDIQEESGFNSRDKYQIQVLFALVERLKLMGFYNQAEVLKEYANNVGLTYREEYKAAIGGIFKKPTWYD